LVLKCVIKFIFMHSVRNTTITFNSVYTPHEIYPAHSHPELRLRFARGYANCFPSGNDAIFYCRLLLVTGNFLGQAKKVND
jgi:hypothetical protein